MSPFTCRNALRSVALTIAVLTWSSDAITAQAADRTGGVEFRVPGGALVPTGALRGSLRDAHITAAQLAWRVSPSVAITGTFSWARSRDLLTAGTPRLDAFTSDVGVELRSSQRCTDCRVSYRGFAGVGAGVRSYNHRSLDADATHNLAGYGAVGGQVGIGRVGVRLEVRDYLTGFQPLLGNGTRTLRNDVVMLVSLSYARRGR